MAESGSVTSDTAVVADRGFVVLLSSILLPSLETLRTWLRYLGPILRIWKVGNLFQAGVVVDDDALEVLKLAAWTIWTESGLVVGA